jgi:hypothetical protein
MSFGWKCSSTSDEHTRSAVGRSSLTASILTNETLLGRSRSMGEAAQSDAITSGPLLATDHRKTPVAGERSLPSSSHSPAAALLYDCKFAQCLSIPSVGIYRDLSQVAGGKVLAFIGESFFRGHRKRGRDLPPASVILPVVRMHGPFFSGRRYCGPM